MSAYSYGVVFGDMEVECVSCKKMVDPRTGIVKYNDNRSPLYMYYIGWICPKCGNWNEYPENPQKARQYIQ